jgi:hypothetical protein
MVARACAIASVALVVFYALAVAASARAAGVGFEAFAAWPLGAGAALAGLPVRAAALALGLLVGWGIPGLALALLTDRGLQGAALLGRALGLGTGYLVFAGLAHAAVAGHAPGRGVLVVLLALPPFALLLRGPEAHAGIDRTLVVALAGVALLTAAYWPKLVHEGLNGDGTEAYELARSLDGHRLPHWDLERAEGPGRFGTPAVNPFLTNSYLAHASMVLLGRGELAARLALVPALALATLLGTARGLRPTVSSWLYAGSLLAVSALWNAFHVGYEPAFTDLAEPAATDLLMTALWLAGMAEVLEGRTGLGVAVLVLASGILYSAPVLATIALATLALAPGGRARPLVIWMGAATVGVGIALVVGVAGGAIPDWYRQIRSEYWADLVSPDSRTPSLPFFGFFLLMTGALPLAAAVRFRRLSLPSRVLLVTGGVYLAIVLASSYKNLHYLAPLPFILAPPALEASGPRLRAMASAVLLAAVFLSWPSETAIHRETLELGRESCLDGLGYEEASLAGSVVYEAFERPGGAGRFAVGKHTFVRYALDTGRPDCNVRLSRIARDGWIPVAGSDVTVSVRDVDRYAAWRLRVPPVPSSWLFPRPPVAPLPADPRRWTGRIALDGPPGQVLALGSARFLVPAATAVALDVETSGVGLGSVLEPRINAEAAPALVVPADGGPLHFDLGRAPWRHGWNVLDLAGGPSAASGLHVDAIVLR